MGSYALSTAASGLSLLEGVLEWGGGVPELLLGRQGDCSFSSACSVLEFSSSKIGVVLKSGGRGRPPAAVRHADFRTRLTLSPTSTVNPVVL